MPDQPPSDDGAPRQPDEILPPETPEGADGPGGPAPEDGEKAGFSLDAVGKNAGEVMEALRDNVQYWVDRGRYNKIRVKRKGKAVLPDIPIGALMAFEAATFFWTGLLRGVLVNVVGRAFFEVEMINEAEEHYQQGLEAYLAGDLPVAETALDKALSIDPRYARAHLQMGIVRKLQGRKEDAVMHFEEAIIHGEREKTRREAEAHLKRISDERAGIITIDS